MGKTRLFGGGMSRTDAYSETLKRGFSLEEVKSHIEQLRTALAAAEKGPWECARLAYEAKHKYGLNVKTLQRLLQTKSSARLSEYILTYAALGQTPLRHRASFDAANAARKTWNNMDSEGKKASSPESVLAGFIERGVDTSRVARKETAQEVRKARTQASLQAAEEVRRSGSPVLNRCLQKDCLSMLQELRPRSVNLIQFDPPYFGNRRKRGLKASSTYSSGQSDVNGLATTCLNEERDLAISLYCDFLSSCEPVLAGRGCVAVFLSATSISDMEGYEAVMRAIRKGGLCIHDQIHWVKQKAPPKNFQRAFSTQTETIWLVGRPHEPVDDRWDEENGVPEGNSDQPRRSNLLYFPSHIQNLAGRRKIGDLIRFHQYEKPQSLGLYLTRKLTLPGETVWDACGCHGNLAIAAIRLNRQFLYTELHPENFAEGLRRINHAVAAQGATSPNEAAALQLSAAVDLSEKHSLVSEAA